MSESLDYQWFTQYFNKFSEFKPKEFDVALQHLNRYALEYGLSEEDLILVTKVSFKQKLVSTRLKNLMKCLIPRLSVPDEVVENVMDWLLANYSKKNVPPFAKKIVLQWFIGLIEYKLIDPLKTLNWYYHLFWYFLEYNIVSAPACNLIYLLAKPEDISRWYVKLILKIHNREQQPKHTGALLLLFKSYRPDCVPESFPAYAVHKAFGVLPKFIVSHFGKAQERLEHNNMIPKNIEGICWYSRNTRILKKNEIRLIPDIIESEMNKLDSTTRLTSITNGKDVVQYLIKRISPCRAMSLLTNTHSRFILIFGEKSLQERFSYQLYYTLHDAFLERNPLVPYEEKDNLLHKLCLLQNQVQECIPVISKFLAKFIVRWDGLEYEKHIYSLLHWLNFKSFDELHDCILIYLYDLFISGTVETKSKILRTLGHLTVNVIITYKRRIENQKPSLFLNVPIKWTFHEVIIKLYKYITNLCKLGWTLEESHPLIIHSTLDINYMIMDVEEKCELHIWRVPHYLCYSGLSTSSPSCLLRLFRLFNRFPEYINKDIKDDYVNSLWYKEAFEIQNDSTIFHIYNKKQLQELKDVPINISHSLSCKNHLALACFNYKIKQENKGKISLEELIENAKKYYPELVKFLMSNV